MFEAQRQMGLYSLAFGFKQSLFPRALRPLLGSKEFMVAVSILIWRRCLGLRTSGVRLLATEALTGLRLLASQSLPGLHKQWQVSSHGRVCNTRGVVSRGSLKACGYYKVEICGNSFFVHRVVAFAFLGPPPTNDVWQVHHQDGDGSNNRLENLRYVTPRQNMLEFFAGASTCSSGLGKSVPVMWRAVGSQIWTTSPSITDAAKQLGMDRGTVSKACRHGKPAKGCDFQFSERCEIATLDGEEWRQMLDPMSGSEVPGRMVSSLGRIRSQTGIISRGCRTRQGYYVTTLTLGCERRTEYVHRLVLLSFWGPPASQQRRYVNHKDLDKGNNAVENLEYVTNAENVIHCLATRERRHRPHGKPTESRLVGSMDEWRMHLSIKGASDALEVNRHSVSRCLTGRLKQTGGFEFRRGSTAESQLQAGEEWRPVDCKVIGALLRERASRQKGAKESVCEGGTPQSSTWCETWSSGTVRYPSQL